jgi:hypothetical protein
MLTPLLVYLVQRTVSFILKPRFLFLGEEATALSTYLPKGAATVWSWMPVVVAATAGLLPARQMRLSVCAFELYTVRTYADTFGTHTQTHTLTRIPVRRRCPPCQPHGRSRSPCLARARPLLPACGRCAGDLVSPFSVRWKKLQNFGTVAFRLYLIIIVQLWTN